MSFSPAFLDELRNQLPLSQVVGKSTALTRAGREFKACCPFHNEKSPSFYVNDDKQFFHCFGCGAHGDIIGFVMRKDGLSFPDAVESLASQAGLAVPRDTPIERERFDHEKQLFQLLDRATSWFEEQLFSPAGREALTYLRGRGLSDEAIRRFRLGFAPNDGQALIRKLHQEKFKIDQLLSVGLAKKSETRDESYSFFRNRVIFPVGDRKGRTVAFGGRVLGEGEPKYLNSPDHPLFHKGKLLYGLSRARAALSQQQPLIVVEGYMDVIAMVEAGYSGAVAPLGTALTEDQLAALWKLLPPLESRDPSRDYSPILCFDGDNAGMRAALRVIDRALPLLSPSQTLRIATLIGAKDPDDLLRQSGKASMDAVLNQAKPMIDMLWDTTAEGRSLRTPEERGGFMATLKQRVARISNETLRKLYHDEIQKRLATAFSWQPAEKRKTEFRRSAWRPPQPVAPILSRRHPPSPKHLRERTFLALMINHPDLFQDYGEDFAHIDFSLPGLNALRQTVIELLSLDPDTNLTADELYRHLCAAEQPWVETLKSDIVSEATYLYAGFARPDRPLEQAREGWKSVWIGHLREHVEIELRKAKLRCAQQPTDENLTRLMALSEQWNSLTSTMGLDLSETA